MKIGIQGQKGSYHAQVVDQLFSQDETIYTNTFSQVFDDLLMGDTDIAVVAIANNRYGFIPESYSEIIDHHRELFITGEYYLPIRHQLIGIPGTNLLDIKQVISQAAAIGQCHKFLENQLPNAEIIEYIDTAASANLVASKGVKHAAAIASQKAAEVYGLDIIKSDIQDDPDNMTRFVVIEKNNSSSNLTRSNKTTAILRTGQKPGSLADILQLFKDMTINISSLHSSFIPNTDFEMQFFIEFDIGSKDSKFEQLKKDINAKDGKLTAIGSYEMARTKFSNN